MHATPHFIKFLNASLLQLAKGDALNLTVKKALVGVLDSFFVKIQEFTSRCSFLVVHFYWNQYVKVRSGISGEDRNP